MKIILRCLLLALLMVCLPPTIPARTADTDTIDWTSFADAKGRNTEDRKYLIYFFSEQCTFCEMLERTTFTDQAVVDYINTNYTPVKVDIGKERNLAARFRVGGVPDLRFLTHQGKGISRWIGYIEGKRLLPLLQYIHTDSYESISYRDFIKKQEGR